MDFKFLLLKAQAGDEAAKMRLLKMYDPLLRTASVLFGQFDEDLYQDQRTILLECLRMFKI